MGPLTGFRVVEFAGLGPCPYAGMLLADLGAEVICIDRAKSDDPSKKLELWQRGKRSIVLNLKSAEGKALALQLIESADALIEGFRPGVLERLGLGPDVCIERNPKLVYGRMTGWGQFGPLAHSAGHDMNYISLTGALHAIGRKNERPVPPLNLVGDFGGGSMMLVMGVLSGMLEASRSGRGQVVDAAMTDGASSLMMMMYTFLAQGTWNAKQRESNWLDGERPYYDTYETKDGKYLSVGPLEPQFYKVMIEKVGVDPVEFADQENAAKWPGYKAKLTEAFKQRTRDEWAAIFEGTDACVAPILTMEEAPHHPHNVARNTFIEIDGVVQPGPVPRLDRTPGAVRCAPPLPGADTRGVLADLGLSDERIEALLAAGAVQ